MQLINIFDQKFRFSLSFIDIYSKNVWVFSMKNKKAISITNAFQKILDESNCKPNKIWVDNGSEFYNRSIKLWLQDNYIEIYSANNEFKSVVAVRFIGT